MTCPYKSVVFCFFVKIKAVYIENCTYSLKKKPAPKQPFYLSFTKKAAHFPKETTVILPVFSLAIFFIQDWGKGKGKRKQGA